MKKPFVVALCSLAGLLAVSAVSAQTLSVSGDPTRPPAHYVQKDEEAATVSGPVLDSVMLPKNGKPLAIISGQQVRLGEYYGENRLIRVTEHEAVFDGPAGIERLSLTPGIEKTPVTTNRTQATRQARIGSEKP